MEEADIMWTNYELEETQIVIEITNMITQSLIVELIEILTNIKKA